MKLGRTLSLLLTVVVAVVVVVVVGLAFQAYRNPANVWRWTILMNLCQ